MLTRFQTFIAGLALALSSLTFVPVEYAVAAEPVKGCYYYKGVQTKAETWGNSKRWVTMTVLKPVPEKVENGARSSVTVFYEHCPEFQGTPGGVSKIKIKKIQVCYTITYLENELTFEGIEYEIDIWDDDNDITVPSILVGKPRNGVAVGNRRCAYRYFSQEGNPWLRMGQSPGWAVMATAKNRLLADDTWPFESGALPYRYFHPSRAYIMKSWHKTW